MDYGVRVVGVNPGQIDTDRLRETLQPREQAEPGDRTRWRLAHQKRACRAARAGG